MLKPPTVISKYLREAIQGSDSFLKVSSSNVSETCPQYQLLCYSSGDFLFLSFLLHLLFGILL